MDEAWEESGRYLAIEPIPSHEAFGFMEDFVEELPNGEAARALERALRLPKPFRSFQATLEDFPPIQEKWFKFHHARILEVAAEWLEDHGQGATLSFEARS